MPSRPTGPTFHMVHIPCIHQMNTLSIATNANYYFWCSSITWPTWSPNHPEILEIFYAYISLAYNFNPSAIPNQLPSLNIKRLTESRRQFLFYTWRTINRQFWDLNSYRLKSARNCRTATQCTHIRDMLCSLGSLDSSVSIVIGLRVDDRHTG